MGTLTSYEPKTIAGVVFPTQVFLRRIYHAISARASGLEEKLGYQDLTNTDQRLNQNTAYLEAFLQGTYGEN